MAAPRPHYASEGAHRYWSGYQVHERDRKVGRALRFETEPFEGESLVGLVTRATAFHVLHRINGVLRRAEINMKGAGPVAFLPIGQLEKLANIVGCSVDDIVKRAGTRIQPDYRVSDFQFGDLIVRSRDLETAFRRIAPGTLKTQPFHRTSWMMRLLPYCEVSYELLRSDCSECDKSLRWKETCGIGFCESCGSEVRPSDELPLPESLRRNYAIFADLLSLSPERRLAAMNILGEGGRGLDHSTIIEMILDVGACVLSDGPAQIRPSLISLPGLELAKIVTTGTEMLVKWPHAFQKWGTTKAHEHVNDPSAFLAHRKKLRKLGQRCSVSSGQATLLRKAFPDLFDVEQRGFMASSATMLKTDASRFLRIDSGALMQLVDRQLITPEKIPGKNTDHLRFKIAELNELKERFDDSISWMNLSRSSGLVLYALEQLCCTGFLIQEANPAIDYLRGGWSITNESLRLFWSEIEAVRKKGTRPNDLVPLGTAVRRIGGRLKPWAAIFAAMGDRSLPFWLGTDGPRTLVRRINVRQKDVVRFDHVDFRPDDYPGFSFSDTCGLTIARDILNLQGMPHVPLAQIFAEDIASRPQFGHEKTIGIAAVLEEARRSISVAEICERKGRHHRQIERELRAYSDEKTATGWKRDVIENSKIFTSN